MLCFVLINSVLLDLSCVWSFYKKFSFFLFASPLRLIPTRESPKRLPTKIKTGLLSPGTVPLIQPLATGSSANLYLVVIFGWPLSASIDRGVSCQTSLFSFPAKHFASTCKSFCRYTEPAWEISLSEGNARIGVIPAWPIVPNVGWFRPSVGFNTTNLWCEWGWGWRVWMGGGSWRRGDRGDQRRTEWLLYRLCWNIVSL